MNLAIMIAVTISAGLPAVFAFRIGVHAVSARRARQRAEFERAIELTELAILRLEHSLRSSGRHDY